MRKLTIVMAYYENPGMLLRHYETFRAMKAPLRNSLKLIIVDDGSPLFPARPPAEDIGLDVEIYRMSVDVRWNQDACRNLGVDRAPDGWLLLTDIDHIIPEKTVLAVLSQGIDERIIYKFSRVSEPEMTRYKPHPNSWLMTKAMFDKVGGYDERFAGLYGTDGDFRDRALPAAPVLMLSEVLIRVPREVTPDASTTTYLRKQPEDCVGIPRVKAERKTDPNWKPLRLTFPWSRVA